MSKKTTSIMAVIVLLLLILAGTFAWRQYNQHKTNEANGPGLRYDVSLIEDFEEIENWKVSDAAKKKIIKVSNSGLTDGSYGDVYVRLQLKEYLEMAKLKYIYTDYRLMIGTDGKFIKATTAEALNDKLTDLGYDSGSHEPAYVKGIEDEQKYWYAKTKAGDDNGQYGKFLLLSASSAEAVSIDGKKRATDTESHDLATNGECNYTVHVWKEGSCEDCGLGFHDYISWFFGEDVISLEEWLDLDGPYGGLPVEKWIYDTRSINIKGWVYWGAALKPQETTKNLLEAVKLIKQPDDNFYYALHVDMEAVSLGEITTAQELKWEDAPPQILTSFTTPVVAGISWADDTAIPAVLTRGTAISMADLLDVNVLNGSLGDAELKWCMVPLYAVSTFSLGRDEVIETKDGSHISKDGVLTIAAGETALNLTVIARSKLNANIAVSKEIPIGGALVTEVAVPAVAVAVTAGTTYTMGTATVKATGGTPSQEVTWSLSGNTSSATTIGTDRVLRVATDETADSVTVTATSKYDTKKSSLPVTVTISKITGITVSPGDDVTVYKGYTQTFAASVPGVSSQAQTVTWSVENAQSTDTYMIGATLKVGFGETAEELTVRATSTINTSKSGTATVTVAEVGATPQVTNIKVSGATLNTGNSATLAMPTVITVNGASQDVIWSLAGNTSTATTINQTTRLLSVGADETAETFQVIATSKDYPEKFGSATIYVQRATSVTLMPNDTTVYKGYEKIFTANVTGVNGPAQTVEWSVTGGTASTISTAGLLTVESGETAETLTVTAKSTVTTTVFGKATVRVAELDAETAQVINIVVTGATVNTGATAAIAAPTVTTVGSASTEVIWGLSGNTSDATKITSGTGTPSAGILTVGIDEEAVTFQIVATSNADPTVSGTATIIVRRATSVTPNMDSAVVARGDKQGFSATVVGVNDPSYYGVSWDITTKGISDATTITSWGILTVASDEPNSTLMLKATSNVTPTVYGEVRVTVSSKNPTWTESADYITGAASDVGKRFSADGYTWRILAVDESGNMLVTTTELLTTDKTPEEALASNQTQFRPTQNSAYVGSTLESVMKAYYDYGIPTLKAYVQPVDIKTESNAEWSTTAIRESGLSVVDATKTATAFALSTSELSKYFVDNADRVVNLNGNVSYFWLRSPYVSAWAAGNVYYSGNATYLRTDGTSGIRPAFWLHR